MKVEILKQNGYNFLWIDGELWMWDIPREVEDQKSIASQAFGKVLVVGYGLGVIQKLLLKKPKVKVIYTVEKNSLVIRACEKVFGKIYGEYFIYDFFKLRGPDSVKYDCIIGDIWLEFSKKKEVLEYLKFKKKAKTMLAPGGKILAWGQDYLEYLLKRRNR